MATLGEEVTRAKVKMRMNKHEKVISKSQIQLLKTKRGKKISRQNSQTLDAHNQEQLTPSPRCIRKAHQKSRSCSSFSQRKLEHDCLTCLEKTYEIVFIKNEYEQEFDDSVAEFSFETFYLLFRCLVFEIS